jgi:tetratricopeptide (TPR) repeat protein
MGMIPPRAACTAARKALATAKELQGESAEGLHVEAFAAFLERRWDAMETAWRRALELQPDHVLALGSFGISLCARQKLDEALPLFERAREADPLASFPYTLAGWGLLMSGRPEHQGLLCYTGLPGFDPFARTRDSGRCWRGWAYRPLECSASSLPPLTGALGSDGSTSTSVRR